MGVDGHDGKVMVEVWSEEGMDGCRVVGYAMIKERE